MPTYDWIPVAPTWQQDPDDRDIWRRVAVMPALALNRAEMDFLGTVAGQPVCVVTVGDGMAPIALAALGAKVTVVDPTNGALDVLMVRAQVVGFDIQYTQCELKDLCGVSDGGFSIVYAAQATGLVSDLDLFYKCLFKVIRPGGRIVLNEYHPFRRIWRPEPGSPRAGRSYFERQRPRTDEEVEDISEPGRIFERYQFNWTIADQLRSMREAGFVLAGMEEVGDTRQRWEVPNLSGLPEQLVLAADRPS